MVKEREHMEEQADIILTDEVHVEPQVPVLEAHNLYHIYGSNQEDGNVVDMRICGLGSQFSKANMYQQ